jgi:hypothetical protein
VFGVPGVLRALRMLFVLRHPGSMLAS